MILFLELNEWHHRPVIGYNHQFVLDIQRSSGTVGKFPYVILCEFGHVGVSDVFLCDLK